MSFSSETSSDGETAVNDVASAERLRAESILSSVGVGSGGIQVPFSSKTKRLAYSEIGSFCWCSENSP